MRLSLICLCFVVFLVFDRNQCSYLDIDVDNECWNKNSTQKAVDVCLRDAVFYWEGSHEQPSTDDNTKTYCCGNHQYLNCAKGVARYQCKANESEIISARIDAIENKLVEEVCGQAYRVGSWKCEFPIWGTVLCFAGFVTVIGVIAYVLFGVINIQKR